MRLYSPVDLTGNVNMIEVILGWDWNQGPPNPQPDALTSAPSSHAIACSEYSCSTSMTNMWDATILLSSDTF